MFPLATLLSLNLSIYRGLQSLHKPHANSVGGAIASPKPEQHQRCTSVIKRLARMSNSDAEQTASQPPSSMIKPDSDEDERDRDARFARASILMVLVFGLCHTPRLITNTMEMFIDQANLPAVRAIHSKSGQLQKLQWPDLTWLSS